MNQPTATTTSSLLRFERNKKRNNRQLEEQDIGMSSSNNVEVNSIDSHQMHNPIDVDNKSKADTTDNAINDTETINSDSTSTDHNIICQPKSQSIETQTDLTMAQMYATETLNEKYKNELHDLHQKFDKKTINLKSFKDDDKKTRFFTGLATYDHLNSLSTNLENHLPECKDKLTKFQVLFICLFRLRLCIPFTYFAFEFNVSHQTVSKYFQMGLLVMYSKLDSLVYWPKRDILKSTMPVKFREKFGDKISIIVDCFEVFIENSSNVEAAAQTFSSYKHGNTAKVLIGITPQGHICYNSIGYGGRASDKFITEDSGFLDNLEKDDVVLADRGFLVSNLVKERGASVIMPAFTKGKSQLHPMDVSNSRIIASLRIHVERVIGLLRIKYNILNQRKLHVSNFAKNHGICIFDQIVKVCSALINFCPSIILSDESILEIEDELLDIL